MYQPRNYRRFMKREGFSSFQAAYKDSDLWISVDNESYFPNLDVRVWEWLKGIRSELDAYIEHHNFFSESLEPVEVKEDAPPIAKKMAEASSWAGVGPMAAVAGGVSQEIGIRLQNLKVKEFMVENGGDLYLLTKEKLTIGLHAGSSQFSDKIGIQIEPDKMPLGVCTSAGSVGYSFSLGKADAVVVLSPSAYHADVYATAIGNMVKDASDVDSAISWGAGLPFISGILIAVGDKLGAWGEVSLVEI